MSVFNNCLHNEELDDLKWWGQKMTWWNKQEGVDKIECKLDRVLINEEWNGTFPWANANFLLPGVSDHSPCVVDTREMKDTRPKPFRFFDMWAEHEDFLEVVRVAWDIHVTGDPIFTLVQKLKSVKWKLKKWSRESFGMVDKKVELLHNEMFQIQEARRVTLDGGILARREKEVSKILRGSKTGGK